MTFAGAAAVSAGAFQKTPLTIAFLGAIGIPGTFGFIAELHALVGAWKAWQWAALPLLLAVLIGAAYGLRTIARLAPGDAQTVAAGGTAFSDLTPGETLAAAILSAGLIVFGFIPAPLLSFAEPSIRALTTLLGGAR